MKDANDLLVASKTNPQLIQGIMRAVYNAKPWRPGGIVSGKDMWGAMMSAAAKGSPLPFECLNDVRTGIGGYYPSQVICWCSGTGMGKSTITREIGYHALMNGVRVGEVRLEESLGTTGLGYVGLHLGRRLMQGGFDENDPAIRKAFDETINSEDFFAYDHFGSLDDGDLISKLRFLIVGCGCKVLILDHISIVVSGMSEDGDERRTIDRLMTALASLAQNTGATIHIITHLRRNTNGAAHEEGARISLADLRGAQAIAQLSHVVLAAGRSQQTDGERWRGVATLRSLKCRQTGFTGVVGYLRYDQETGRTVEVEKPEEDEESATGKRRGFGSVPGDAGPPF